MSAKIACIAGHEIYSQWEAGRLTGEKLGPRQTPFGDSGDIFRVDADGASFYLLPRYAPGMAKTAPCKVNDRVNMYALKDLGTQCVLAWGPGGAVTHNFAVGDLVVLNDVIDFTYLRHKTFFEDSPLGYLRQFPVFCPSLRRTVGDVTLRRFRESALVPGHAYRGGLLEVCCPQRLSREAGDPTGERVDLSPSGLLHLLPHAARSVRLCQ